VEVECKSIGGKLVKIMVVKDNLTEDFVEGIEDVKKLLIFIRFQPLSFDKKGLAYFVKFHREKTIIEFIFGPSDWDIELIIYIGNQKFAFKDLLEILAIAKWVDDNRYRQAKGRDIKKELLWFVELLKVSLHSIECSE
jgi:hypothetical protein